MQVLDEQKRAKILEAAASLFATQPFHKVLLSDVAEAAGVGKGTLYIYFKSKDDLYVSVMHDGFDRLLGRMRQSVCEASRDALANLRLVVGELVSFAIQNPRLFELMRTEPSCDPGLRERWHTNRRALWQLFEKLLSRGVATGQFKDPHPDLTARIIPGAVRSIMLEDAGHLDADVVASHILFLVESAICPRRPEA